MGDPIVEPTVAELAQERGSADADSALAALYAPILLFDAQEPFFPLAIGYTLFREKARSHSAHRQVDPARAGARHADTVIEYAIWWDFDISHLYELEHIWVYLDANGEVVHAEGSQHGRYRRLHVRGETPLAESHLTVYSEAGKHGFAATRNLLERLAPITRKVCMRHAGLEGVLITWLFRGIIRAKTPEADRLVHTYLERYAFEPSLEFGRRYAIAPEALVPWPMLYKWIPRRVNWWVSRLREDIPPHERRFLRIAWRGASANAPENTLTTIAKAANQGADLVKLDVQHSPEGVPVIAHGQELGCTTNDSDPASRHTLEQLRGLGAGDGQGIPTLEEGIAHCREHGLGLYLELASDAVVGPVVKAIRRHHLHDRIGICSSRHERLAAVRALDRKIVTALLLESPSDYGIALARAVGAQYVQPIRGNGGTGCAGQLTPEWVRKVRAAGLGIICSQDCLPDLTRLRQLGVDAVCSRAPNLLLPRPG